MATNQVPALQEVGDTVQGTSPSRSPPTTYEIRNLQLVADTIQQTLPLLLKEALKEAVPSQPNTNEPPNLVVAPDGCQHVNETPQLNSRLAKYYTEAKEARLSDEVTTFLTTAFTKRLSKEVWSELMQKYPPIKGLDEVLVAPTMETGTKEHIKQKFGYHKTKEIFASDDGLVERQTPFLAVARPIAAALERLEETPDPDDEVAGPDPDEIKATFDLICGARNALLNTLLMLVKESSRKIFPPITSLSRQIPPSCPERA